MKVKELNPANNIEESLREIFKDYTVDELRKYADMSIESSKSADKHLKELLMSVARPKSPETIKLVQAYSNLINNLYKTEMRIISEMWRERKHST